MIEAVVIIFSFFISIGLLVFMLCSIIPIGIRVGEILTDKLDDYLRNK